MNKLQAIAAAALMSPASVPESGLNVPYVKHLLSQISEDSPYPENRRVARKRSKAKAARKARIMHNRIRRGKMQ